jgi:hypothetical protein
MSAAEEIAKFYELYKAGAITDAEFATAKAKLLGATATPPVATPSAGAATPAPSAGKGTKPKGAGAQSSQKMPNIPSPVQTGVAVAAGFVGGRLIADQLLDDPSTDPTSFATETITFPNGDVLSGSAVEMPNGDFFYSVTETSGVDIQTVSGTMTAEEVEEFIAEEPSVGDDSVDSYSHDPGVSSTSETNYDYGGFEF